ncbi:MAG TPA: MarR family transcriptional regulator [Mycobacteriales bacterium]|nr:MarR family transcriptional regulator [Mycobacteriales bacterium]
MSETVVPPVGTLSSSLRLAVVRLNRCLRSQRADPSVTLTHIAAMNTLTRFGPMTPGELAAHEKVQPPSMTRVLASLEERGLVARAPHPTDGRQVIVALTEAGTKLIEEVRAREAWLSQRLKKLSNEDRETLRAAIEVMDQLIDS